MAARKKKAAKKAKRAGSKAKKATRKTAKRGPKKAQKQAKTAAKEAPAKKKSARKTKGEGDYAASRAFLKDQSSFVGKNKAKIASLGKEAEKALEGPEGADLREAEAIAAARSRDTF